MQQMMQQQYIESLRNHQQQQQQQQHGGDGDTQGPAFRASAAQIMAVQQATRGGPHTVQPSDVQIH